MKFIRRIISWIYTLVIVIRHRLYDWGVFKSFSFDIPIICVGNITVGGTGKTPTAEFILTSLANHYTIAILSRGYGRTTKGYHEVSTNDSYSDVGDEPLQIKLKYPNTVVVVSEDRVAGIERIRKEHPEVNLFMPLVLGSLPSFVIMLAYIPLIIKRIKNEEAVLLRGLDGYADYCRKVRYRIIPFIY